MKLYHGTAFKNMKHILQNGIEPRGKHKEGNWEKFPSYPGHVYLTNAYPYFFAEGATENGEDLAIVELSLSETFLFPDEDFLREIVLQRYGEPYETYTTPEELKPLIEKNKQLWSESLKFLGTCSYKGVIAPLFIRRHARIQRRPLFESLALYGDPVVNPIAYQVRGDFYRKCLDWIFDESLVHPQVEELEQLRALNTDLKRDEGFVKALNMLEELTCNPGIEIINVY